MRPLDLFCLLSDFVDAVEANGGINSQHEDVKVLYGKLKAETDLYKVLARERKAAQQKLVDTLGLERI